MAETLRTTDPETIRRWTESRGGTPCQVRGTGDEAEPGILRIDFPGYSGEETLEPISWSDWLRKFEDQQLAFLYQEQTDDGEPSHFNKLVRRD